MDTAPPTTSKLTISVEAAAIVDCSCPRAAACIAAARAAAARSSRLTAPSTASSDAGHRLSGGATSQHLARPCHQSLVFAILSPARFFWPPKERSTELRGLLPTPRSHLSVICHHTFDIAIGHRTLISGQSEKLTRFLSSADGTLLSPNSS